MLKTIREKLYFIKVWYKDIFRYPKTTIVVDESLDYDRYWKEKRGPQVGVLSDWQEERAQLIIHHLKSAGPCSIGDIGCGEGSILLYLKKHLPITKAVGYDTSDFVLDKARAIGIETIKLNITDREELKKITPTDYHIILETLEHIPNSEEVLSEAYKKSARGVFFSFPNTGFFIYRLRMLFGRFPKQWINFPNEHIRFWTLRDVRWWLRAQGYTKYQIHCYKGIPFLNRVWPSLFAGGLFVFLKKPSNTSQ